MRFAKIFTAGGLMIVGTALALGNLWVTAQRSGIPRRLDATITDKELRLEKHKGVDDVLLITIDDDRMIQVERQLFDSVNIGDEIHKDAWSSTLHVSNQTVEVEWSRDVRRMLRLMPLVVGLFVVLGVLGCCDQREDDDSLTPSGSRNGSSLS